MQVTEQNHRAGKVRVGTVLPDHRLVTVVGEPVRIPDPERVVHLQFRRFAGCPICNAHLRTVARRHDEIRAAGIREIVLFHSTAEDVVSYLDQLPFDVVADPDKQLYREFGVESSARAVLDPRTWMAGFRGSITARRPWAADHHTGHLGLPADFLVATDGRVLASKHGVHAYDQWSVDELLELVAAEHATPR
jgi:peroxiredoxin